LNMPNFLISAFLWRQQCTRILFINLTRRHRHTHKREKKKKRKKNWAVLTTYNRATVTKWRWITLRKGRQKKKKIHHVYLYRMKGISRTNQNVALVRAHDKMFAVNKGTTTDHGVVITHCFARTEPWEEKSSIEPCAANATIRRNNLIFF
jgi:hypothetical protein